MSFYLDTSVLVPLYISETTSPLVEQWLEAQTEALHISDLTSGEFAATTSRLVRMNRLTQEEAGAIIADFQRWCAMAAVRIPHEAGDVQRAAMLVREPLPRLLMPDAIHIATCERTELTLVTLDRDLWVIAGRAHVAALVPS